MMTRSDSLVRLAAAFTVVLIAALMMTPVSARTPAAEFPSVDAPLGWTPDPDEDDLTVAEFGIDPMVTGPVSEEFRQRQAALGCLEAKWPNIPAACYPEFN